MELYNALVQIRFSTSKTKLDIKSRHQLFLVLSNFTWYLYFVSNILPAIIAALIKVLFQNFNSWFPFFNCWCDKLTSYSTEVRLLVRGASTNSAEFCQTLIMPPLIITFDENKHKEVIVKAEHYREHKWN